MRKDLIAGLGLVLFSILLLVFAVWDGEKKEAKIEAWASRNGFEIVKIEEAYFDTGPFDKQQGENVYRVRVKDQNNQEHVSWFKIVGGVLFDQKWEPRHKVRIFD